MKTLIRNCRIVSPGVDIPKGDILVEDDRIVSVGREYRGDADEIIAGDGLIAAPGFIDIHKDAPTSFSL